MTTENKSETKTSPATSNNKAVFAPLGKYAAIAVIMVSIIVTTAIMLNKQLDDVGAEIAALEVESSEIYEKNTDATTEKSDRTTLVTTSENTEINADVKTVVTKKAVATDETVANKTVTIETANTTASSSQQAATAITSQTEATQPIAATAETPSAEVLVAKQATTAVTEATSQAENTTPFEMATVQTASQKISDRKNTTQSAQAQMAQENQARIDNFRAEQKQHMSAMFARIKTLETTQLDRFKTNQDEQITRLREQIAQQQKMIDALIARNKDILELRAANVERKQAKREQMLNRI